MSRKNEELLSAYFDGELTSEERDNVERLLADSDEAQRQLREISAVSELIRTLPPETVPEELAPRVLRQAERELLLGGSGSEPARVTPAGAADRSPAKSPWLAVAATVTATAAAAVVAVTVLLPETRPPMRDFVDAQRSQAGGDESAGADFDDDLGEAASERVALGASPEGEMRDAAPPMKTAEELRRGRDGASPTSLATDGERRKLKEKRTAARRGNTDGRPGASGSPPKPPLAKMRPADMLNEQRLRSANAGDVIPYLERTGEQITTYTVTVVDVQRALGKFQMLLLKNDIPVRSPDDPGPEADRAAGAEAAKSHRPTAQYSTPEKGPRLFAVYVQTTPERLASTLEELKKDKLFADLQPVPQKTEEVQLQVAEARGRYRSLFRDSPQSAETTTEQREPDSANGRRAVEAPRPAESKATARSESNAAPYAKPDSNRPGDAKLAASADEAPKRLPVEAQNPPLGIVVGARFASVNRDESFQVRVHIAEKAGRGPENQGEWAALPLKRSETEFAANAAKRAPRPVRALFVFRAPPDGARKN